MLLGFKTPEEAKTFAELVHGAGKLTYGTMTLSAPFGAVLTAKVDGPDRSGVHLEYPYVVDVGVELVPAPEEASLP